MDRITDETMPDRIARAIDGDEDAANAIAEAVRGTAFNLSLRMLGNIADAEDAAQEIVLKVMGGLGGFKNQSLFSTWVFRVATNYLLDLKRHRFAETPFRFERYADDVENAPIENFPDPAGDAERAALTEELKLSCANVMLQCFDKESRCIFILGTMFRLDSKIAAQLFDLTPEAYRQRLSRVRKKMADFMGKYCGAYGDGKCDCEKRIGYAAATGRLDPARLEYAVLEELPRSEVFAAREAMEAIDGLSERFRYLKLYRSPEKTRRFYEKFSQTEEFDAILNPNAKISGNPDQNTKIKEEKTK